MCLSAQSKWPDLFELVIHSSLLPDSCTSYSPIHTQALSHGMYVWSKSYRGSVHPIQVSHCFYELWRRIQI